MKTSPRPAAAKSSTTTSAPAARRLTIEEERALVLRAQGADPRDARRAAGQLAAAHMPYMQRSATRFVRSMRGANTFAREEALSACLLGFMVAIGKFDVSRAVRFLTYANYWFNHFMQRAYESSNVFGHAPSGSEEKAIARIGELGTDPAVLAVATGVQVSTAAHAVEVWMARAISLDAPRFHAGDDGGEGSSLLDRMPSDEPSADEALGLHEEAAALRAAVTEGLAALPPRYKTVVLEVYMADEAKSFADVGRHYGVSRERVRQVGELAKERLRKSIRARIGERMARRMTEDRVAA